MCFSDNKRHWTGKTTIREKSPTCYIFYLHSQIPQERSHKSYPSSWVAAHLKIATLTQSSSLSQKNCKFVFALGTVTEQKRFGIRSGQTKRLHTSSTLFANNERPPLHKDKCPYGVNSCNARTLFDSCSQKSYISAWLRSKLSLPLTKGDLVLIRTFGNNELSLKPCSIVQFALEC